MTNTERKARALEDCTNRRLGKLMETDHWAFEDTPTMTQAQINYRQELRDWSPGSRSLAQLENPVWPTKP